MEKLTARKHCVVKNCRTNRLPLNEKKLFTFPRSYDRRAEWLSNLKRLDLLSLDYNHVLNYRVCVSHFKDEHFQTAEKLKLNRFNVIPIEVCEDSTSTVNDTKDNSIIENVAVDPLSCVTKQSIEPRTDKENIANNTSDVDRISNKQDESITLLEQPIQNLELSERRPITEVADNIFSVDETEADNMSTESDEKIECDNCKSIFLFRSAYLKNDGSFVCENCADTLLISKNKLEDTTTSLNEPTLELLVCCECEHYLSCSPVYLLPDGRSICGRCSPPESAVRNKHYETLARLHKFPCRFKKHGCPEMIPFAETAEDSPHEKICTFRKELCPVNNSGECKWTGRKQLFLQHCLETHLDRVLMENPFSLSYNFNEISICSYLLTAFQMLFIFHTKLCIEANKIYHSIQLASEMDQDELNKFKYTLNIRRGKKFFVKTGCISPRGKFDYSTDKFLITDLKMLEKLLGGNDNIIFTITVIKLADSGAKCIKCKADLTQFLYKQNEEWYCVKCIPNKAMTLVDMSLPIT